MRSTFCRRIGSRRFFDFTESAAASGWAFSFGYLYNEVSAAYMAVRGSPERDGPFETFACLPTQYGMAYEMALTAEPDWLWSFTQRHVDASTPIMSEHMDGGLIVAYRTKNGRRQLLFDGTVMPGYGRIAVVVGDTTCP